MNRGKKSFVKDPVINLAGPDVIPPAPTAPWSDPIVYSYHSFWLVPPFLRWSIPLSFLSSFCFSFESWFSPLLKSLKIYWRYQTVAMESQQSHRSPQQWCSRTPSSPLFGGDPGESLNVLRESLMEARRPWVELRVWIFAILALVERIERIPWGYEYFMIFSCCCRCRSSSHHNGLIDTNTKASIKNRPRIHHTQKRDSIINNLEKSSKILFLNRCQVSYSIS